MEISHHEIHDTEVYVNYITRAALGFQFYFFYGVILRDILPGFTTKFLSVKV